MSSDRPRRHLFGVTLTLAALATMLAVGMVYVGTPMRDVSIVEPAPEPEPVACSGFCPLSRDLVAVTMPIDVQGSGRSVKAGDYVNVIATVNTAVFSPVHPRSVSRRIFTGVAVIHVGPHSTTIVLSLCDAHYLDWFAVNASLAYTVGSPNYETEIASANRGCQLTADPTPAQVDARWEFTTAW